MIAYRKKKHACQVKRLASRSLLAASEADCAGVEVISESRSRLVAPEKEVDATGVLPPSDPRDPSSLGEPPPVEPPRRSKRGSFKYRLGVGSNSTSGCTLGLGKPVSTASRSNGEGDDGDTAAGVTVCACLADPFAGVCWGLGKGVECE